MVIQAPAPPEKVDRDDLSLLDLFVLGAGVLIGLVLVLWQPSVSTPSAGSSPPTCSGTCWKRLRMASPSRCWWRPSSRPRHPRWTFLAAGEYLLMAAATVALLVGLLLLDRWVIHVGLGALAVWGYFVAAGVASALMAGLTYLVMRRPRGFEGSTEYVGIHVLAGSIGLVLGAGLVAGVIGTLAWYRQANLPKASISIPAVHGIAGRYVAIGDSYSAGGAAPVLRRIRTWVW
jgi:hypothetical protein